jgi:hypothetical protein
MGWTIRHQGTAYEIDTGDGSRVSVLLAGGTAVDEQTADYWESSTLTHGDTTFEVRWGPRNTITSCALVEIDDKGEPAKTPLVPPPGSKVAKQEAFQREHPTAYVVRRTAWAGFEILIGLLGISALLGGLLPRLDLGWLPRPSLPDWLPELSRPEWLRYLDITYWLGRLGLSRPDIGIPGWAEVVLEHKQYWLPLVVAALVALGQLERRRKIDAERAEQEREKTADDDQP